MRHEKPVVILQKKKVHFSDRIPVTLKHIVTRPAVFREGKLFRGSRLCVLHGSCVQLRGQISLTVTSECALVLSHFVPAQITVSSCRKVNAFLHISLIFENQFGSAGKKKKGLK